MAVAALSTAGFSQYVSASSNVSASQQAWQSLQQSLAAGNLSGAQSAFDTYTQLNQNLLDTNSNSSSSSAGSQLSTELQALGSAISSGNLSTAQSAFNTLQNDLNSSPSQAITNAESAASQTVQWVDDLLSLSGGGGTPTAPQDPTTSILDSAYGYNPTNNTDNSTDPTASILNSAYGSDNSTQSTNADGANSTIATSGASTPAATSDTDATTPASTGNTGSSASVNVYA